MSGPFDVVMLVASKRTGSINERLARAIERTAPGSLKFRRVSMFDLPFYDGDLEGRRPDSVNRFAQAIRESQAICIVTPEYNRSIPAVLKNAIDWASKPVGHNQWRDKVIAMAGTSPGGIGTALAQQHLRQILSVLYAMVLPGETYISFKSPDMIDAEGNVTDPSVSEFLAAFGTRFAQLVARMHAPMPQ
jgi:chromate reductase, NAD(P)H dehydrogenase (quinone)